LSFCSKCCHLLRTGGRHSRRRALRAKPRGARFGAGLRDARALLKYRDEIATFRGAKANDLSEKMAPDLRPAQSAGSMNGMDARGVDFGGRRPVWV
jgi:hypothetical protein